MREIIFFIANVTNHSALGNGSIIDYARLPVNRRSDSVPTRFDDVVRRFQRAIRSRTALRRALRMARFHESRTSSVTGIWANRTFVSLARKRERDQSTIAKRCAQSIEHKRIRFHVTSHQERYFADLARARANPETRVIVGDNKQTARTRLRDGKERYERSSIGAICCAASNRNAAMRQHGRRLSVTDTLASRSLFPPKPARRVKRIHRPIRLASKKRKGHVRREVTRD